MSVSDYSIRDEVTDICEIFAKLRSAIVGCYNQDEYYAIKESLKRVEDELLDDLIRTTWQKIHDEKQREKTNEPNTP